MPLSNIQIDLKTKEITFTHMDNSGITQYDIKMQINNDFFFILLQSCWEVYIFLQVIKNVYNKGIIDPIFSTISFY